MEKGSKGQTSSYKMSKSTDAVITMVTIANNAVWHIGQTPRE